MFYRGYIWTLLPALSHVRYNGVIVDIPRKPFDQRIDDVPAYEKAIVVCLRTHVRRGDSVVVVGGGWGVSTVVAAQQSGEEGSVVCYEGSEQFFKRTVRAVHLNHVAQRVTVKHALVSHAVHLMGPGASDVLVKPEDLPECDVLELDCEGSEIDILDNIVIRPRVIVVETHGLYGAPTADVVRLLESLSYDVQSIEWADERRDRFCQMNDIRVVAAITRSPSWQRPHSLPPTRA